MRWYKLDMMMNEETGEWTPKLSKAKAHIGELPPEPGWALNPKAAAWAMMEATRENLRRCHAQIEETFRVQEIVKAYYDNAPDEG